MAAPDFLLDSGAFGDQPFASQHPWSPYQTTIFDQVAEPFPVEPSVRSVGVLDSKIEALAGLFPMQVPQKVKEFLQRNPALIPLLSDSAIKIREYWGVGTRYELRLVIDPEEAEEDATSLVVAIFSSDPSAYAILDRFDEEWWLDRLPGTQGRLNFLV